MDYMGVNEASYESSQGKEVSVRHQREDTDSERSKGTGKLGDWEGEWRRRRRRRKRGIHV